jgi:transcriptional regulator of arginine metabolism
MSQARDNRKEMIREIILTNEIRTQADLIEKLEELGISVKQAAVSRDVKDLELRKDDNGIYTLPEQFNKRATNEFIRAALKASGARARYVMNQVVVRTGPGAAQSVAAYFDTTFDKGVLGTVAGDDTILIICESEDAAKEVANHIDSISE